MRDSRARGSGRRHALRPFAATVTLTAAVALAGCQSNPAPPPVEAAPSPSPSPTQPTTEPAPTMPAEAQGTSRAAAKAFVRHYFAVLNHAMNTGDTAALRRLSSPDCESCVAIAENIESTYAAGGQIRSEGWRVQSVSPVPSQPTKQPILDLGVLMTTEHVTKAAGVEPETFRGGKQPMTIHLLHAERDWRVVRLDRVA